jgi:hypothetical protein
MLDSDDGGGAGDPAVRDHRSGFSQRDPAGLGRLVRRGLPGPVGAPGDVQILRVVGVAGHRLEGQDKPG